MNVHAKVTASTLSSAIAVYVFDLLADKFGLTLDPVISALVIAVLTAAVTFAAGWLKKEHVITQAQYDSFEDAPEADPLPVEPVVEAQTAVKAPVKPAEASSVSAGVVTPAAQPQPVSEAPVAATSSADPEVLPDLSGVPEDVEAPKVA